MDQRLGSGGGASTVAGKVALVTGASGGIGAAVVATLLGRGARVVGVARRAGPLAAACSPPGLPAGRPVTGDITVPADVERAAVVAVEAYGRLDILVSAAGVLRRGAVEELAVEAWEESLAVNLTGSFLCARTAVRQMLRQDPAPDGLRGHIVHVVSGSGVKAWVGASAYSAAKFGLMGFSEALREEVRFRGIKVSDVLPGPVATAMTSDPDMAEWKKLSPEDVAAAIMSVLEAPAHVAANRLDVRHILAR